MPLVPAWLEARVPTYQQVRSRLGQIFPEGMDRRKWLTNPNAARSVFVFLYCLCIEGNDRWLAPKAVIEMSVRKSTRTGLKARTAYFERIHRPGQKADGQSWLAPNSREGIRDEAIRALREVGAVVERPLPKTSGKGRYALAFEFADLFDPARTEADATRGIAQWREKHLDPAELARLAILGKGTLATVTLPDGTTQKLAPGPSQPIIKAVIESFAVRYLVKPVVLSYSDGSSSTTHIDKDLMRKLKLVHQAGDPLPDVLLADLASPLRFVFVEAVATEGPTTQARVNQVAKWLEASGYKAGDAYFATAYLHRGTAAFRATVGEIAWRTAIWFVAETEQVMAALD